VLVGEGNDVGLGNGVAVAVGTVVGIWVTVTVGAWGTEQAARKRKEKRSSFFIDLFFQYLATGVRNLLNLII
jgi:cytochrome c oxidase assembly factor CtaG